MKKIKCGSISRGFLSMMFLTCVSSAALAKQPQAIDQAIYVMTLNQYAAGFSEDSAKFDDLILIEIVPGKNVIKKNAEIPFFCGGVKSGTVKLQKKMAFQCDSQVWGVKISDGSKLEKDAFAVASKSSEIKSHDANERKISKAEEEKLLDLALKEFKKNSFSVNKKSIEIRSNRVILDNAHPDSAVWAGSFTVKNPKEILHLFLIADIKDGSFSPAVSNFKISKDLDDEKDIETESYVDHFSMKEISFDKIITEIRGYETMSFRVYKKTSEGWKHELTGGESGC